MTARRLRPWLVVLPLTLAGAVACGTETAGSPGAEPPTLSLSLTSGVAADSPAGDGRAYAGAGWRLRGTLPAGVPGPRPIIELPAGSADESAVSRLTHAFGLSAAHRVRGGWLSAKGRGPALVVRDTAGEPWNFTEVACPAPITPDSAVSGITECAVASGVATVSAPDPASGGGSSGSSGSPTTGVAPTPPPIATIAQTRGAAQPVFDALGLAGAHIVVRQGYASADPVVDGLPSVGMTTSISVDATGRITYAGGWLPTPRKGSAYPLISAGDAFAHLRERPMPMLGMPEMLCPVTKHGPQRCPGASPQMVTGARLGLTLTYRTDGRPLLVPAWLFTVRGTDTPIAEVAVAPRFLATPTPPPVGRPAPVPTKPGSIPPAPPAEPEPTSTMTPQSYRTEDGGRTLVLQVTDGICPPATYTADAKESDREIIVVVTKHPEPQSPSSTATACPEIARIFDVSVQLQGPLGNRSVVTADGTEIPPA